MDDGFWSHPKTATLSDAAVTLWVRGGSYCCQHLTDGFVKQAALRLLGVMEAVGELVDVELWHIVDGGWVYHDWDEYQETSVVVKKRRDDARERQRKSRETRDEQRRQSQGSSQRDNDVTDVVTDTVSNGVSSSPPTRPDPTRPVVSTDVDTTPVPRKRGTRSKPKTHVADDFLPQAKTIESIRAEFPHATNDDLEYQNRKFRDHWAKVGTPMADWDATWRNWIRTANERGELGHRGAPVLRAVNGTASAVDDKVQGWMDMANATPGRELE